MPAFASKDDIIQHFELNSEHNMKEDENSSLNAAD